ncbi:MAG: hypothetical protein R3Y11_07605 [Pseudomonadota bacterium]
MPKLSSKEAKKNQRNIDEAFIHREDSNRSGGYKTIDVQEATWTWHGSPSISFKEGFSYCSPNYTGDYNDFHCTCIEDHQGGISSEFSPSYQHFNYNKAQDIMTIKGHKGGLDYTVEIKFK